MSSKRNRRGRRSRHEGRSEESPALGTLYFEDSPDGPSGSDWSPDTKTLQMCRQVQRRLDLVLSGELSDPILQGLWVNSVVPEPGGRSLLVHVIANDAELVDDVRRRLNVARPRLRSEVAAAICRKRTPHLQFVVLPAAALTASREEDEYE